MNFSQTLKQIESSKEFKEFKKKNKDAYLCAGFFVLDYEQGINQQQLDYSLKDGKIYTFILNENEIAVKEAETIEGKEQKLPELNKEIKIDLENLKEIAEKRMEKEGIENKITKIIAILQKHEDNQIWNLTCMMEGFGMLQVHINCVSGEILKFEKRSMFDFVKRVK